MIAVDLRTHITSDAEAPRHIYLRELAGYDELSNGSPVELIDGLLLDRPGAAARPGDARRLTLSEADRVLAAVYRSLYGDAVECHVTCPGCRSSYELSFTLSDMWDALTETTPEDEELLAALEGPDGHGVYRWACSATAWACSASACRRARTWPRWRASSRKPRPRRSAPVASSKKRRGTAGKRASLKNLSTA